MGTGGAAELLGVKWALQRIIEADTESEVDGRSGHCERELVAEESGGSDFATDEQCVLKVKK